MWRWWAIWTSWNSFFEGNSYWGAEGGARGKSTDDIDGFEHKGVWHEAKKKPGQGEAQQVWAGAVWEGMNANSLAISTNEILKVSSSWEEGSWTWCDRRSVKELKFLRENKTKVSTCSDVEAERWGGEDTSTGQSKKDSGTANKKEMEGNKNSEGK